MASIDSAVSESMNIAILLTFVLRLTKYPSVIASVDVLQKHIASWSYLSMLMIVESKWRQLTQSQDVHQPVHDVSYLAAMSNGKETHLKGRQRNDENHRNVLVINEVDIFL